MHYAAHVAALEDKIVQRATVAVLNAIYEEDFLGFSYGFRPKRGQHDALDALAVGIGTKRVNFILDADVASFFDSVSKEKLVRFVEHRVGDPRIIRLIQKWLKAGVLEDGVVTVSESGTGQGSVISPLLANVYLHYTFDLWAERWRRREATGDMIIVRYADDIIVGFEHEADARRFWEVMRERLQEFSLSLNSEKTRLIEFGRHAVDRRARRGLGKPETFKFLGFTHICGQSRRGAGRDPRPAAPAGPLLEKGPTPRESRRAEQTHLPHAAAHTAISPQAQSRQDQERGRQYVMAQDPGVSGRKGVLPPGVRRPPVPSSITTAPSSVPRPRSWPRRRSAMRPVRRSSWWATRPRRREGGARSRARQSSFVSSRRLIDCARLGGVHLRLPPCLK